MVVISDTSPISSLIIIGRLNILHLIFDQIYVPPAVDSEIRALSKFGIDISSYLNAEWLIVAEIEDEKSVKSLLDQLDLGESQAIVVAIEKSADYIIIDERLGSTIAKEQGLKTIGLLGVLVKAKQQKIVNKLTPILASLRSEAGFWMSDQLVSLILETVGEQNDI